jgi:hypothetical protein
MQLPQSLVQFTVTVAVPYTIRFNDVRYGMDEDILVTLQCVAIKTAVVFFEKSPFSQAVVTELVKSRPNRA